MKKRISGLLIGFLLASSCSVFAVGQGSYMGVGVNWQHSSYDLKATNVLNGYSLNPSVTQNDTVGTVFAGYGQSFFNLYLGGEIGNVFPNTSASLTRRGVVVTPHFFVDNMRLRNYIYADLTPGYKLNPCWLVYARVGVAYSQINLVQDENREAGVPTFTFNENSRGLRLGLSTDYQLTCHLSAGADYIYTNYQDVNSVFPALNTSFRIQTHVHMLGAHLRYNFA